MVMILNRLSTPTFLSVFEPCLIRGSRILRERTIWFPALLLYCSFTVLALASAALARAADEPLTLRGAAPPQHAVVGNRPGGAYFAPRELKQKYGDLLANLAALRAQELAGAASAVQAHDKLQVLRTDLDQLRKELDGKKIFVSPAVPHDQEEEFSFELGADKLLVITADNIRLRGSDEPRVRCVLEKTVLGVDKAETDEFDAIRLVHRQGHAPELVGRTLADVTDEEREFLASDRGRALTDAQRESRRLLVNEIQDSYAPYRQFQGKQLDVLQIEGLTYAEGNRQVLVRLESEGGEHLATSTWRRHARLTVYVPRCRSVLLRGCLAGLDVEDVHAPLIVTDAGSADRDYDGSFTIDGVEGALQVYNVPLDRLQRVRGDVAIVSTAGFSNTGTRHEDDWRIHDAAAAHECTVRDVDGDFSAWFVRETLKLENIVGQIDVNNEAGDTLLTAARLAPNAAHRVISDSGIIEIAATADALSAMPVMAVTNTGSVCTKAAREVLDDVNFTTGSPHDGTRRNWRGVRSTRKAGPESSLDGMRRPAEVLANEPRAAGLDLISRSGAILVRVAE